MAEENGLNAVKTDVAILKKDVSNIQGFSVKSMMLSIRLLMRLMASHKFSQYIKVR